MQIFTHRGLEPSTPDFSPESSYEAFESQLSRGFGVEFDPNFVKDGIIISHDSTLTRITNGKDQRNFHDVTVAEVTAIRYTTKNGDGTPTQLGRIATLEELLQLIVKSPATLHALHLKGKFQKSDTLARLVEILNKNSHLLDRFLIFDAKPETARYIREQLAFAVDGDQSRIHIAPSIAHPYDIERYNQVVLGTLISIEAALRYKLEGIYDWAWLDEWDLKDKNNGHKTLYNAEVFGKLKNAGYKISLVTPELHGTSPGLLGGEAHEDAETKEKLFARIKEIVSLQTDAICTDYPKEVSSL